MSRQQFSYKRADHWDVSFWLIFASDGGVRLTRGRPPLHSDERAMSVAAKIPHSLFKVPELQATISLPDNTVAPIQLDLAAGETALTEAFGARVELSIADASIRKPS